MASTGDFDTELYTLYNAGYSGAFTEVSSGYDYSVSKFTPASSSNDYTRTNSGDYPTATGYNMFTGLGSPVATGLACSEVVGSYSGSTGQPLTLDGLGLRERLLPVRRVACHGRVRDGDPGNRRCAARAAA